MKTIKLTALLLSALTIGLIVSNVSFARVTSAADDRDIWCVGVSGAEVCVDSSGNMIPTTDDDADLGTSSLQWQDLYLDGTLYVDAISNEGDISAVNAAFTGTLDADGQVTLGAAGTVSTITAAGVATFAASVTAPDLTATDDVVIGDALDVDGQVSVGADGTKSTVTVLGAATFAASVTAPAITGSTSVSGLKVTVSGGPLTLYSRTEAQILLIDPVVAGELYFCSDCTTTTVCVSTGTAVADMAAIEDPSAACD